MHHGHPSGKTRVRIHLAMHMQNTQTENRQRTQRAFAEAGWQALVWQWTRQMHINSFRHSGSLRVQP